MLLVQDFLDTQGKDLNLTLVAGKKGLTRPIVLPEVQRPGLSLAGYLKNHESRRILIFGGVETHYLKDLKKQTRLERLKGVLTEHTPMAVVAGNYLPPKDLVTLCEELKLPLFRTEMLTMHLLNKITFLLSETLSPSITCQGTLIEAFGVGVLIEGDSSVGKSEAALGMIEKGHRLVSDDVVKVRVRGGIYLEGMGPDLARHVMEIRGIGIINVAHLYGAVCVRESKRLDIVVKLEEWDEKRFYDRVGLEDKYYELLGIKLPYYVLPVKPGRDVVLLLETIVLNYSLKKMGYHSAQEFKAKLSETITRRQQGDQSCEDNFLYCTS